MCVSKLISLALQVIGLPLQFLFLFFFCIYIYNDVLQFKLKQLVHIINKSIFLSRKSILLVVVDFKSEFY